MSVPFPSTLPDDVPAPQEIPGIPRPPGTRWIKLSRRDVEWIVHTGPYPFTCTTDHVQWTQHTEEQVIKHHTELGTAISMKIVRKLMGEIE